MSETQICPQALSQACVATLTRTFEFFAVHPGWFVYRLRFAVDAADSMALAPFSEKYPGSQVEGFAPMSSLEALRAGSSAAVRSSESATPLLVPSNCLPLLTTVPAHEFLEALMASPEARTPYSVLLQHPELLPNLRLWSHYSSTFSTMDGQALPAPVPFSYSDGQMCDGAYHLERALAVLQKDPRIAPADEASPIYPERGTLRVQNVPYYNRRPGCLKTLDFVFTPTQQDMCRILGHCPDARFFGEEFRRSVFELDVLGLRAAGAARFEHYGESDESAPEDPSD